MLVFGRCLGAAERKFVAAEKVKSEICVLPQKGKQSYSTKAVAFRFFPRRRKGKTEGSTAGAVVLELQRCGAGSVINTRPINAR